MAYPKKPDGEKCIKQNFSIQPELLKRIIAFCQKDERSMSYVVQKAVDQWLKERGF